MTYLLDVNALLALAHAAHTMNARVGAWVTRLRRNDVIATSAITELGFVRIAPHERDAHHCCSSCGARNLARIKASSSNARRRTKREIEPLVGTEKGTNMTTARGTPDYCATRADREALPNARFPRTVRLTTTAAMMGALFSHSCVGPDESALGGDASGVRLALTTTLINDANIPNHCMGRDSCFLMNELADYQTMEGAKKPFLRSLSVRVSDTTPSTLGTCSAAGDGYGTWNLSAGEFAVRQPLLNTRQVKISVTCADGVITNVTMVRFRIVLTTAIQSPSAVRLDWVLPNAPSTHRYHVYRDDVRVASSISGTNYTSTTQDGIGHFYAVEVDPASFPGGDSTWSPKTAVMSPLAESSLWMAGTTLFRVDPATGWKGAVGQQTWSGISGMTDFGGFLFIVNGNSLRKVNVYTGQVVTLGGENWVGPTMLGRVLNSVYIWANPALWKVNSSTGTYVRDGTLEWPGVTAMTSDNNYLYIIQNGTLYMYGQQPDDRSQLGTAGAWSGTSRMVSSWKRVNPNVLLMRLYMLRNGRLWEHDPFSNVTMPVGNDTWPGVPPLSANDDFLFLLDGSTFYKVDKQTGTRTAVASGWPSASFLVPN